MQFTLEKFLHVAAVVEAGERIAHGLQAEGFAKTKVGNGDRNVFRNCAGEVELPGTVVQVGVRFAGRRGKIILLEVIVLEVVVLNGQDSDGFAEGDKRNTDGSALAQKVGAARARVATGMNVDGPAPQGPAFRGRDDLASGTDAPWGNCLEARFGGGEKGAGTGGGRKETAQALRDEAKDLLTGGASLEQASEFADLRDFSGLAPGVLEEVADSFVRGGQLLLRGLALENLLLLVVLRERQTEGERQKRGGYRDVGEKLAVGLFPTIHQQVEADKHCDQTEIGPEEAEEFRRSGSRQGLWVGCPGDGDESRGGLIHVPGQVEPRRRNGVVMPFDPVAEEGGHRTDEQEESEAAQQAASAGHTGELQAKQDCDEEDNALGVTDVEITEEGICRLHLARRKKEEGGIDDGNDNRDLKKIEKDFR